MADGLTIEQAPKAVDLPQANLTGGRRMLLPGAADGGVCEKERGRQHWQPVEHQRQDNPMWGKRKIAVPLTREGSPRRSPPSGASCAVS